MSITINISEASEAPRSSVSTTVDSVPAPPVVGLEQSFTGDEAAPAPPLSGESDGDGHSSVEHDTPLPPEFAAGLTDAAFSDAEAPAPPSVLPAGGAAEAVAEAFDVDAPPPPMAEGDAVTVATLVEEDEASEPAPPEVAGDDTADFSLANLDMDPPSIEGEPAFDLAEPEATAPSPGSEEADEEKSRNAKSSRANKTSRKKK